MAAYASELESHILRHGCTDHQSCQLVEERDLAAANICTYSTCRLHPVQVIFAALEPESQTLRD